MTEMLLSRWLRALDQPIYKYTHPANELKVTRLSMTMHYCIAQ